MKSTKYLVLAFLLVFGGLALARAYAAAAEDAGGAVFVMTNATDGNQIAAFTRSEDGTLRAVGSYSAEGNGSGETVDPLHSQGSLPLSRDHRLLFAANAGSGSVSSFEADSSVLHLTDTKPGGGSSPTAVAEAGDLLCVLNAGGNGNVSGFHLGRYGRL